MTREIFAAEISFEDIPALLRERFAPSEREIKKYLSAFREAVDEVYILSTEARFTVYIVHENIEPLTSFFYEEHNLKGYVQLYYNSGESVAHLMAMASGLLSTIKGDMRILGQVSLCYQWAKEASSLGLMLDHTVSRAIEVGTRIRKVTGIDQFGASLVDTGIELLYSRLENLHQKNIIVVGTGTLAAQALESLAREGFANVSVTGYHAERAQALGKQYGMKSFGLRLLPEYFSGADIIIAAEHRELSLQLEEIQQAGHSKDERIILDFGVPPNFDENKLQNHCAEFYNLDDLRRLQPSAIDAFGGVEEAWRKAVVASNEFVHLLQLLNHAPILTAYLSRQFYQRGNEETRAKYRRSLRDLLFRRSTRTEEVPLQSNTVAQHVNNRIAEDGDQLVRQVQGFKKFRYYLPDN